MRNRHSDLRLNALLAVLLVLIASCPVPASDAKISDAVITDSGWSSHSVESEFQAGTTEIRVLLPDDIKSETKLRVLYVLPVEANSENRWGDGLAEIKKHDIHNNYKLICVAPTFSHLPWYADHPTGPGLRQESYLLKVVIPFVEETYPAQRKRDGRLLVGFSKSGWGAFSLLLRHPDLFAKAAAWDAPLMKDKPNQFGMGPIFGTQKNFDNYQLTSLAKRHADALNESPRLVMSGAGNFRQHHQEFHAFLDQLQIPHVYVDGLQRTHHWGTGWLEPTIAHLVERE